MGKRTCENCGQVIGNLEESFFYNNHVVCKSCKAILQNEFQAPKEVVDSNIEREILNAEIPPQVATVTKNEPMFDPIQQHEQKRSYGGIRRTGYFFGMLVLFVIQVIIDAAAQDTPSLAFLGLAIVIVGFVLVVNRLNNIGRSGWWSLLILVPIANLFVGIPCLMLPEGYEDTKKLDTAGKIIAGILIGMVVVMLICMLIALLSS